MNIEQEIIKILYPNKSEREKKYSRDLLFNNLKIVKKELSLPHNELDNYLIKERWNTTLGKVIYTGVKRFITDQLKIQSQPDNKMALKIDDKIKYTQKPIILDFTEIHLEYQNKKQHINSLWDTFETSKFTGYSDLRGIDMSGYSFQQITIKNGQFSNSNFRNSRFNVVKFQNCFFNNCNFENAKLVSNAYTNTSFSGANMKKAWIDNISSENISNILIKKISYIQIIHNLIRMLFKKKFEEYAFKEAKYNFFASISIKNNRTLEDEEFSEYIFWFERLYKNINKYASKNLFKRMNFALICLSTKLWNSFLYLLNTAVSINIIYSILYMYSYDRITGLRNYEGRLFEAFIDALYFSVITFTTLGFGDISPNSVCLKLLVISEVLIGYTILGIFIFLLSNKLARNIYK